MLNCAYKIGIFYLNNQPIRGSSQKFVTFSKGWMILECQITTEKVLNCVEHNRIIAVQKK